MNDTHTQEKHMLIKMISIAVVAAIAACAPVTAEDLTLDMLNKREDGQKMVFSQDVARIEVGDTITWLPKSKGHNVEFRAGPDGAELPKKSKQNKEVVMTFETAGTYFYWCTPHKSMGMIGLVIVGNDTSNLHEIARVKTGGRSKKKLKKLIEEIVGN